MSASDDSPISPTWLRYRPAQRWAFVAILFFVALSSTVDRAMMSLLVEPIKAEFKASDTMMGVLTGFAFATFYALMGIPIARWSDYGNRRLVITLSVLAWTIASVASGLARSFLQLAITRVGVGAGEAGGIPPAQSLIADYFPPELRTRAYAVFSIATAFGSLLAFVVGAQISAHYGWRVALIAMGAPGLLLCVLTAFGLSEPRLLSAANRAATPREPLGKTLSILAHKRSYMFVNLALGCYFIVSYGVSNWQPAYLERVLHLKMAAIGPMFGAVLVVSSVLGLLAGGFVTDFLAKRDIRWLVWLPSAAVFLSVPFYVMSIASDQIRVFYVGTFFGSLTLAAVFPAILSLLQIVSGPSRRAMAISLLLFMASLVGGGLGPFLVGAMSDLLSPYLGPTGLRWALQMDNALLIPMGIFLFASARTLQKDAEY